MNKQSSENLVSTLLEGTVALISGLILGIGFSIVLNILGITFPSLNQITNHFSNTVQIWTNIASIESPKVYAVNTTVLVAFFSAVINSWNRNTPSSAICGILTVPGVAVWSYGVTKLVSIPFVGSLIYGFAAAMRVYLWIGSMVLYLVYLTLYILNTDASLLVVTVSVILASMTFGAVFGRFEKGLVLSIKSTAENFRNEGLREQSRIETLYWSFMIPVSLLISLYFANLIISSQRNPTVGELLSSSTSVFISTFIVVIGVFYFIFIIISLIFTLDGLVYSYRNNDWRLRAKVRTRCREYVREEFTEGEKDNKYGYPKEVADTLRNDYK